MRLSLQYYVCQRRLARSQRPTRRTHQHCWSHRSCLLRLFSSLKGSVLSEGKDRGVNTIGSIGSPNIHCPSTGASMRQLYANLASLMLNRGFITSCKRVLSSNDSESMTVNPVLGRTVAAHVPSLDANRYSVKRPPVLYCDLAMNFAYHAQICICIT